MENIISIQELENNFYSQLPQKISRVLKAREIINKKTLSAYIKAVKEFKRSTSVDIVDYVRHIEHADENAKLSSSLHTAVYYIAESMKNDDAKSALKNIMRPLMDKSISYQENYIGIGGFKDVLACEYALSYLNSEKTLDYQGRPIRIFPSSDNEIAKYKSIIESALNLIKEADKLLYEELQALVSEIYIFKAEAIMGASFNRAFGAIFIAFPEGELSPQEETAYFVEHLVHESSHLLLYSIMETDPLILNNSEERYTAPLRTDLRPMYGIFHATFVISRMLHAFRSILHIGHMNYKNLIVEFLPRLKSGISAIESHAQLTAAGLTMLQSISHFSDNLSKEFNDSSQ